MPTLENKTLKALLSLPPMAFSHLHSQSLLPPITGKAMCTLLFCFIVQACAVHSKLDAPLIEQQPATATINKPPSLALNQTLSSTPWIALPQQAPNTHDMPHLRLVSVNVQQLPIVRLLQALAVHEGLSFALDDCGLIPITLSQFNVEITQLLRQLESLSQVRIQFDGKNIHLRCDQAVVRSYLIDYPAVERQAFDQINTGGLSNASLSGGASGGTGINSINSTGSSGPVSGINSQVSNRHQNKFWEQIGNALEALLAAEENLAEPIRITETDIARNEQGLINQNPASERRNQNTGRTAPPLIGNLDSNINRTTTTRVEQRNKQVTAHPESGLIAVRATAKQHEKIQRFLAQSRLRAHQQVDLQASIVEVRLSRQFQQGIQWSRLSHQLGQAAWRGNTATLGAGLIYNNQNTEPNTLNFALRLLSQFGDVRVLSNPRLVVLNQQTALMKLVENRVYFTVSAQVVPASNNSAGFSTFNTQAHTVPVGFVMSLTPSIDQQAAITLAVRPRLSRIVGFVTDPNPTLVTAGISSRIPEIQTREIESVLKLQNGDTALLGGFVQAEHRLQNESLPGLENKPLGWLTGNREQESQHTELVILLQPKITDRNVF